MGFGILFIGYFLLFNIPYFGMTDMISAAIMMAGLNKLASINKPFAAGYKISMIYTVYAIPELVFFALNLFGIYKNNDILSYLRVGQSVILCALTVSILKGIMLVAKEVSLDKIPKRAERLIYLAFAVYVLWILCNAPIFTSLLGSAAAIVYLIAILSVLLLVFLNLITIYTCYMHICMPEDNKGKKTDYSTKRRR